MKQKLFSGVLLAMVLVLAFSSAVLAYAHPDDARIKAVYFQDVNEDGVKQSTESYWSYGETWRATWVCEVNTSNCRNNFDEGDSPMYGSTTFTKLKSYTNYVIGTCAYNPNTGNCLTTPLVAYATTGAPDSLVNKNMPAETVPSGEW